MKTLTTVLAVAGVVAVSTTLLAQAPPTWLPPAEKDRCPAKWGAGDERGAAVGKGAEQLTRLPPDPGPPVGQSVAAQQQQQQQ